MHAIGVGGNRDPQMPRALPPACTRTHNPHARRHMQELEGPALRTRVGGGTLTPPPQTCMHTLTTPVRVQELEGPAFAHAGMVAAAKAIFEDMTQRGILQQASSMMLRCCCCEWGGGGRHDVDAGVHTGAVDTPHPSVPAARHGKPA